MCENLLLCLLHVDDLCNANSFIHCVLVHEPVTNKPTQIIWLMYSTINRTIRNITMSDKAFVRF